MKRCERLHAMSGLSMLPLKEGGEDRAKQIPSQPRGDRDPTCEDAHPSHGSFIIRANVGMPMHA